VRKIIKSW